MVELLRRLLLSLLLALQVRWDGSTRGRCKGGPLLFRCLFENVKHCFGFSSRSPMSVASAFFFAMCWRGFGSSDAGCGVTEMDRCCGISVKHMLLGDDWAANVCSSERMLTRGAFCCPLSCKR